MFTFLKYLFTILRSQIVKEVTSSLSAFSLVLGKDLDPLASKLIESLLKLTYITIQCIRDSGSDCLRNIILCTSTGFPRAVIKILDGANSKNEKLRCHAMACLALALRQWNPSSFSKTITEVTASIKAGISGSSPDVRSTARQALLCLEISFPEEAHRVEAGLNQRNIRQMQRDRSEFSPSRFDTVGPTLGSTVTDTSCTVQKSSKYGNSKHRSNDKATTTIPTRNHPKTKSVFSHSYSESTGTSNTSGPVRVHQRDERRAPFHNASDSHRGGNLSKAKCHSNEHMSTQALRVVAPAQRHSGHPYQGVHFSHNGNMLDGPKRVQGHRTQHSRMHSHTKHNQDESSTSLGGARRVTTNTSSISQSSHGANISTDVQRDEQGARRIASTTSESHVTSGVRKQTVNTMSDMELTDSETAKQLTLSQLLRLSADDQWHSRAAICTGFSKAVTSNISAEQASKVSRILADRLGDGHYRVAQAALRAVPLVVQHLYTAAESTLVTLLPPVFLLVPAAKRETQQLALDVLRQAHAQVGAEAMLPSILQSLSVGKPRVQCRCLEISIPWFSELDSILTNRNVMKKLMSRLCTCHGGRSVELRRASSKAMLEIYRRDREKFMAGTLMLSLNQQKELKKGLEAKVPDIARQLSVVLKSSARGRREKIDKPEIENKFSTNPNVSRQESPVNDTPITDVLPSVNYPVEQSPSRIDGMSKGNFESAKKCNILLRKQHEFRAERVLELELQKQKKQEELVRQEQEKMKERLLKQQNNLASNWGEDIPTLLSNLEKKGGLPLSIRSDALHQLARFAREGNAIEWVEWFQAVLDCVLRCTLFASEMSLRESSLSVLRDMALHQPHGFVDYIDVVASKLIRIKTADSNNDIIKHAAQQALTALLNQQRPERCLETMCKFLNLGSVPHSDDTHSNKTGLSCEESHSTNNIGLLITVLDVLSSLFERVSKTKLEEFIPKLMPSLVLGCDHSDTRIRKGAIGRITDIHFIVGNSFATLVTASWGGRTLRKSQLHLVNLFLNRKHAQVRKHQMQV